MKCKKQIRGLTSRFNVWWMKMASSNSSSPYPTHLEFRTLPWMDRELCSDIRFRNGPILHWALCVRWGLIKQVSLCIPSATSGRFLLSCLVLINLCLDFFYSALIEFLCAPTSAMGRQCFDFTQDFTQCSFTKCDNWMCQSHYHTSYLSFILHNRNLRCRNFTLESA